MTEYEIIKHGVEFLENELAKANVWAPLQKRMKIKNISTGETNEMEKMQRGYWSSVFKARDGDRYTFITSSGKEIPDPAARFMPEGIDSPSMIVDTRRFRWKNHHWKTYSMKESIIQEIHVGTYTGKGTYSELEHYLEHIENTGINTVELMPLAQTYGSRNWGYDGVFPFSPSYAYGSPEDLKEFVDSCHGRNINVILDVVYNHLGPLGNVFTLLGYYFNPNYHNPWGDAINFDGRGSDEVRSFVLQNIRYWLEEYRMDGLRMDAIHSIQDSSPVSILEEITDLAHDLERKMNRHLRIIAETDRNDPKTVMERDRCGMGFSGQWNDDFHHALHSFLSGERSGYYVDYGAFDQIVHAYKSGYVYDGVYSEFLDKKRGAKYTDVPMERLVVFTQDHDQVGNRAFGERPISIFGERKALIFATAVLTSPFTPMLFMGEEFGCKNPFLFFMETKDIEFAKRVSQGRRDEFAKFKWDRDIPDPSDVQTFLSSKVDHERINENDGQIFLAHYRNLISLRKKYIQGLKPNVWSSEEKKVIVLDYEETHLNVIMCFSSRIENLDLNIGGSTIFSTEDCNIQENAGEMPVNEGTLEIKPFSAIIIRTRH